MDNKKVVKKYLFDIVFVTVSISLLTWFWFGPYKDRVRIKESLKASNIVFNTDIKHSGFDYLEFGNNNKITKELSITNNDVNNNDFIISFDNLGSNTNNYISYIITDSEGNSSDVRNLSLDGYILENNINVNETKKYTITIWSDSDLDFFGNLELVLVPNLA